ncbi:MAG TPA: DUF3352 domain-containing protein [Candidatus Limnocylindrales bacterium]
MTEPLGPGVLEPTTEAVPTTAVEVLDGAPGNGPVAPPHRARRLRWAFAAVFAVVVLAAGALSFAALAGGSSTSAVVAWAPSDAVAYTELRADMPGDQRANLLAFLSHFPGFADQTNFDAKADDGLNKLVQRLTNSKHDFSAEIKPWFSGQLGVSVEAGDASSPAVLLVASVRDSAAAATWLKSIAPAGATHETAGGVDLTVVAADTGSSSKVAWGLDGSVLLAGSIDTVKAAISRGPSGALAGDASFKAASAALDGDSLGTVYVDLKAYLKLLTSAEAQMLSQVGAASGGTAPALALPSFDPASLPGWLAMRVRAESDHLVLDEALPTVKVAGVTPGQNRVGTLAASLPSDTVAQYEVHDFGTMIKSGLTALEKTPGGPTAAQVDDIAKYVGGVDKAIGWIGDTDAVVLSGRAGFSGGLVAQTTDPTASADLVTALKSLATLGGAQAGIALSSETYNGHTINLVKAAGLTGSDEYSIAFSLSDKLVIVGVGDSFVKSVLDTKSGSSLADQPAYQRALGMAGTSNVGQAYVDVTALRTGLEALAAGSSGLAAYASDVKPFLEPIQSIALSQSLGSDVSTGRFVLVVK